jgi:hypothetical protein
MLSATCGRRTAAPGGEPRDDWRRMKGQYIEANLALKEQALSRIEDMPSPPLRYRADNELLRFLEGL